MTLILIQSPKGGVGRTTVAASLAAALASRGSDVTVVDYDSQDALKLHFGWKPAWTEAAEDGEPPFGVDVVPYGRSGTGVNPAETEALIETLLGRDGIVIADLPAHDADLAQSLAPRASLKLCVLLADGGSMALLPGIVQDNQSSRTPVGYVINQFDNRRRLARDAMRLLSRHVGNNIIGVIRRDEAVAEAVAMLQPISAFAPASAAATDFDRLATTVLDRIQNVNLMAGTAAA